MAAELAALPRALLEPLTPRLREGPTDLLARLAGPLRATEPVQGLVEPPDRDRVLDRDLLDISPTMPRRNESEWNRRIPYDLYDV